MNVSFLPNKDNTKGGRSLSHQPHASGPGDGAVACVHPAVPRQQALEDIPHDHDDGDPQSRAHQDPSDYPLAVCRHVATVDGNKVKGRRLTHVLDQVRRKHNQLVLVWQQQGLLFSLGGLKLKQV